MEDEIASMAAINRRLGRRSEVDDCHQRTGFSLMQENIGYAVMAENPMRGGRCAAVRAKHRQPPALRRVM